MRVNRLVTYWKSGAHLKFDNSPWEVDGSGTGPAKSPAESGTQAVVETGASGSTPAEETPVDETKHKG